MKHAGRTPPFRTPTGEILPGSIAEVGYQRLGGIDQWVMIRSESIEARLFRHFNAPLERSFTVVYWDQRGTNKSFDRRIPASSHSVAARCCGKPVLPDIAIVSCGFFQTATIRGVSCFRRKYGN
jgi:hypothetical protein